MNYQRNQQYFQVVNYKNAAIAIGVGALIFLVGASQGQFGAILIGLLVAAAGVGFIYLKKKSIVTDMEYDASVASMLNDMKNRALNKLGVDEDEVKEIEPIPFEGYVYKGATQLKRGQDGLNRTNKYQSVMLFFSASEVHCYTYNFDTITPKQSEDTDVYFYRDIVSVSTASESVQVLGQNIEYEYFKLTTAGGTALTVSLRNVDENVQRSINAMRALLRAKKQG